MPSFKSDQPTSSAQKPTATSSLGPGSIEQIIAEAARDGQIVVHLAPAEEDLARVFGTLEAARLVVGQTVIVDLDRGPTVSYELTPQGLQLALAIDEAICAGK